MKVIDIGFMTESWDVKSKLHSEDYKVMPGIDKERYTELPGLEGPFSLLSGKVVYYDPKEGKYYDRDSDMYMDYEEIQSHDKPRTEDVEQTEMKLGDPRSASAPEETSTDPMDDKALIGKIKSMIAEYKKTKDKTLLRPIMEEMAKLYAPEAKEMVDKFENDPIKTTRGNYGKYMQVLSGLEGLHRGAMTFALRDAGAGRGLDDALRIVGGR